MQNAVRSGMGLLGMHPSASLAHSLHQPGLAGQRMPGLMPLDVRANLLQSGAAGRFPLLMQPGPTQSGASLLDSALQAQARARAPFPLDHFSKAPNLPNDNVSKVEDEPPSGADEGKDQDYRFPPMEKPSTGLLRTPPREHREPLLGGGGGGRPPLLQTPGTQPARTSLVGRLQALAGFTPDNRWNQIRGDFDERDGPRGGLQTPGGPKGFQEERSTSTQNFPNRFDSHPGPAGGAAGGSGAHGGSGGPQAWNRTSGGSAAFDSELRHQDLDERRRPWDRQRDRDERDFDFRREMNGGRHSRERDRERGREQKDHDRDAERDKDRDREREHGSWAPLLPLPTPLLPTPPLNPNLTLNQGKLLAPLKINPQLQQRFQSALPPQAQSKPLLQGLNQPPPQIKPLSQGQAALLESKSESPVPAETLQPQPSPSSHHFPDSKSPVCEARAEAEPSLHSGSSLQIASSQSTSQYPSNLVSSPESKTPSETSPPYEAPVRDAAFAQAATPPRDSPCSVQEQRSPQVEEEDAPHQSSPPQHQWANGPGIDSDSVAESTPEPSPESSPDSLLAANEAEQQEQPFAFAKDVDSDQSEPMEDSASQPVLDSVTDTEGT